MDRMGRPISINGRARHFFTLRHPKPGSFNSNNDRRGGPHVFTIPDNLSIFSTCAANNQLASAVLCNAVSSCILTIAF